MTLTPSLALITIGATLAYLGLAILGYCTRTARLIQNEIVCLLPTLTTTAS